MTMVLADILERAAAAESAGLIATALKLYQKAQRSAWNNAGGSTTAREGMKRMRAIQRKGRVER